MMLDLYLECLRPKLSLTCPRNINNPNINNPNINNPNTNNPSPSSQPAPQLYYPPPQTGFQQPSPYGMGDCPNCGSPLQPYVNFCDICGTQIAPQSKRLA